MDGMKAAAVHALEEHEVAARVGDGDRNRDAVALGDLHRGLHHLAGAGERQAFGRCDVHWISAHGFLLTPAKLPCTSRDGQARRRASCMRLVLYSAAMRKNTAVVAGASGLIGRRIVDRLVAQAGT